MLISYIKTAFRVLLKNKLYAIINIIGLSVAIACGIVAYLNYQFSQSFDSYHVNKDRIYRLNSYKIINNQRENWAITPMPLAPALKENISGVEDYTRIRRGTGIFRYDDKVFNEDFHYVDKDFFNIFTFPLKYGTKNNLLSNDGIVITQRIAEKYFGNINPVGKQIAVTVDSEQISFLIDGVIENPPLNSSLYVSILLPMSRYKDLTGNDPGLWSNWSQTTFLLLKQGYPIANIESRLHNYIQITDKNNTDWHIAGFYLDPLPDVAFHSMGYLRGNILKPNLHPAAIIGPTVIALLILLLACFNFLNTSIAFSGKRLNEIAVRKVLGVKKFQLVAQFLGESFVLCLMSIIGGIMLSELFVPAYANLWPNLSFPTNFINDWRVILFLIALLLCITVSSGIYPAIYISRFESINILRNKQKLKGSNPLIRILLVFQFTLSITTIITGFIFYENAGFIKNYDMGFNTKNILIVPVQNRNDYELLKSRISGNPLITEVSSTRNIIGFGYNITEAKLGDLKTQLDYLSVGEDYLESMGLKITQGRSFNKNIETDYSNSLLVNQSFMNKYNWTSINGKTISLTNNNVEKTYHVIGVVKDFNITGVWQKIEPIMLKFSKNDNKHLVINYAKNESKEVFAYVGKVWKQLFPNLPFDGFFQSVMLDDALLVSDSISTVMFYVALLALIISAMGMFALISLSIAKRTKEIGIRKALGASVWGIGKLVSKEYIIIFIISSVISVFAGYYLAEMFIASIFAYYVEFGILPFLLSILIVLGIAILTIGSQLYKAATSNPVDALRYE